MKSMKLREIVQVIKPEYVFLKLKPNNSIRNNNTHKLARTIAMIHKNMWQNVKKDQIKIKRILGKQLFIPTKFTFESPAKVAYYLYIEKTKVEFYFIIPRQHYSLLKEKISDVWTNITIEEVDSLPVFGKDAAKYQLSYTKEDALSLAVDRRNNDLLTSILNVIEVIEEPDKVGVLYNFLPTSQFTWRATYRATMDKVKRNLPVDRDKTGSTYWFKMLLTMLVNTTNLLSEVWSGKQKEKDNMLEHVLERMVGGKQINPSTQKKATATVIDTQILVMSESPDILRQRNNARSLAQSFDTITDDNSLRPRPYRGDIEPLAYKLRAAINKLGDDECENLIALPGREILERYNVIGKVETQEMLVPVDLRQGVMCIGTNRFRGVDTPAFLSNDQEFRNLLTLLIGPTRAGKSNLIANLCVDAIEAGECVVLFDFIENCELSDSIIKLFPSAKVLEVRCDDFQHMQGLGYNEVGRTSDTFKAYENAKRQTSNVLALVNSVHADESRLTPKMERYLESASLVVFINHGSIKDVFGVLQNHKTRAEFLSKVPAAQHSNLDEYMESLKELDDEDKNGRIIGTRTSSIIGIIDRLNTLKRNAYMELMLKKDCSTNINLVDEFQKNQIITIKMPQSMFTTDAEKDICTTYWITKIWLALQVRADKIRDKKQRTKVNLIIDELYQVDNTERFITSKLSQIAKFICKPIISCHYINQLSHMRDELRSANTSYLLISGCDKKNYDELKNELYPFTDEDLRNLPRWYSLNYIKSEDGYARFITKLPGKVETRSRRIPIR